MRFRVTLTPAEEGGFVAQCVEVPGAISEGDSREEALANISDAIQGILQVRLKEAKEQARKTHADIEVVDVDP